MVAGMPIKSFIINCAAVLFACLLLTACNTNNFAGGLGSGVPPQNVGTNIQNPDQTSETALVENLNDPSTGPLGPLPENTTNTQFASLPSGPGIAFLPITGAPQHAVTGLSRSLKNAANSNGINMVPANSGIANYRVKGYFSALDDGSGTLLVYVWDVLDKGGSRLHRISGQQHTNKKSANPWTAVTNDEIDRVAIDTMTRLRSWLASR